MNDKNTNESTKPTSNPFSTGGGGASFENLVAAFYASNLMCEKLIHGHLEAGEVKEISFQNRWTGLEVDDILVYGSAMIFSEKHERNIRPKLILQIKNRLNFRSTDSKFTNVIMECWQTFNHSLFNLDYDKIGILLSLIDAKVKKHFIKLLDWAITSDCSAEYFSKLKVKNYTSQEMRDYLEIIKKILPNIQEDNLWEFFRHLKVLELDLSSSDSKSYLDSIENLRSIVIDKDYTKAIALFSYILEKCAYYNKNGGRISFNTLYHDITVNSFLEQRNAKNYWEENWGTVINTEFLGNLTKLSNESKELQEEFNRRLSNVVKNRTRKIQEQIEYITDLAVKDKSKEILNSKKVLEYQLTSIKSISVLAIFNQLSESILEFFQKGFVLSLRIQDKCHFASQSIYNAIGMETAIPYVDSEFFSHKLRAMVERYYEKYPHFRESITHFYHGFLKGLVDSSFFDSGILYAIELGLDFLYKIGYKTLDTKENTYYYDLTNHFVLELCHKLAINSPIDLEQPTSLYRTVFKRILNVVLKKTVQFKNNKPLVIGVKLYILDELFSLPIPVYLRLPILDYFNSALEALLKTMNDSSISHVFFFASLQKIWMQIFPSFTETNPKIYQNFLLKLLKIYSSVISLRIKTEQSMLSHPIIDQMNRTFIDLLYHLFRLPKQQEKNNILIDIYTILNKNLLKLGDDIFKKYPNKNYYKCILEPLSIIRFLMINYKIEKETVIITQGEIFDSLCSIGTLILMSSTDQEDNNMKFNYQFSIGVRENITKVYPFDDFSSCIEDRQGNWKLFGASIGRNILHFHYLFSNPETVYKVLGSLKFDD